MVPTSRIPGDARIGPFDPFPGPPGRRLVCLVCLPGAGASLSLSFPCLLTALPAVLLVVPAVRSRRVS